jgi:hypothetical protein
MAVLALTAPAGASTDQFTILQEDRHLLGKGPTVQDETLDELDALGVDVIKFRLDWRGLAPQGDSKPTGFGGEDPADYPADEWVRYDRLIRGAKARGMDIMIMVGGRAPAWAAGDGDSRGIDRPDPIEFKRFLRALGTRYSGTYAPAGESALPRVTMWSLWNEVNIEPWLKPQYLNRSTPLAPHIYRRLFVGGHQGLTESGHGKDLILIGELAPFARRGKTYPVKIRPLKFLREMACLDDKYRPFKGKAARLRGCNNFKPLPGNGLAYHPYCLPGGPTVLQAHKDEAAIAEIPRVTKVLDRLYRKGRLQQRKMPVYNTEFAFQTDPPDPFATPIERVPGFLGLSEWLAFVNKRVLSWSQYTLVDDPISGSGSKRFSGFQDGLKRASGKPKKGVYEAFQMPLFVRLLSSSRVEVFGGVRSADSGGSATIEIKSGKRYVPLPGGTVALGPHGYFRRTFRVSGARGRAFRFRFGDERSRSARPLKVKLPGAPKN